MVKDEIIATIIIVSTFIIAGFIFVTFGATGQGLAADIGSVTGTFTMSIIIPSFIALFYLYRVEKKKVLNIEWKKTKIAGLVVLIFTITFIASYLLHTVSIHYLTIFFATIASVFLVNNWSHSTR